MKRILSILLLMLLCATAMASCGGEMPSGQTDGEPYAFVVDGTEFVPGGPTTSIFAVWRGQAPKISTAGSCLKGVDGEDVIYVYSGFSIRTFRENAQDPNAVIVSITLTDDSVSTAKGIAIGATAQAVVDAYGEPTEKTDSLYLYERGGTQLRFGLRDGVVTNVSYTLSE